jgi:type I restriction enzyme S subunit
MPQPTPPSFPRRQESKDVACHGTKSMDSRLRGNDVQKHKPNPMRLGDVVNFKRGYDLPESARRRGPYPVISSAGISGYHDEYKVRGEGVVTGRYGTLGEMHYYNGEYWPHNTALYVTDFKGNFPKYVYYLLTCLGRMDTGDKSTVPGVNRNDLHELKIPFIADKHTQKRIASVLSTLDSKIDLNHRINAELEALAKTIYDYWFVQFDFPDANGRPYKSSGGKMVWNEALKREIPAGWEVVPLSRLVEEIKDGVAPNASDSTTPYVGLEHIARRSIVISSWETADKATSNKIQFRKGDILFGKIRPYFHKVALAMVDGIASTDAIVMRPRQHDLAALALESIFSDRFVEAATASSTGSKMPRADWSVMRNYSIAIPSKSSTIANEYQRIFDGVRGKIENNAQQTRELTHLRDWLLPLLMNGQVRVAQD